MSMVVATLGDVAEVYRGTVPARPTEAEGGIPFFGLAELAPDRPIAPRLVEPDPADGKPIVLAEGDVVVALMSKIGRSALVTAQHAGAVLGRECALVRPGPEVAGAWIYVWTQSAQFRDQVGRHTSGTTMPRLSYRALASLEIPMPTTGQQQRAAAVLNDFDDAIGKVTQVQAYLTELRAVEIELLFADPEGSK